MINANQMHQPLDIEAFRWRLAETIAWCSYQAHSAKLFPQSYNPRNTLREAILRPPSLQHMALESNGLASAMRVRETDEIKKIVDILANERALLLRRDRNRSMYPSLAVTDLNGGRLLRYAPYDNLADGAAEESSSGFFDVENEPPWDTWIDVVTFPSFYSNGNFNRFFGDIICWIPPDYIQVADRDVSVNPEVCIEWLDQSGSPSARQLRDAGLC